MTVRWVAAAVVGLLAALGTAAPAEAHGQDAPIGTNVRILIDKIELRSPGVTVRTVEAGAPK